MATRFAVKANNTTERKQKRSDGLPRFLECELFARLSHLNQYAVRMSWWRKRSFDDEMNHMCQCSLDGCTLFVIMMLARSSKMLTWSQIFPDRNRC